MRIILLLIFISPSIFAQTAQKDINQQVWKTFIKAFDDGNTDLFMNVHSKDLIRSPRDGKEVLNWDQYKKQMADWAAYNKQNNSKLQLELHFTERIDNGNQAVDVGVYKTTSIASDGTKRSDYGRFHVVLRKENNTWKILVDTDSSEGGTIGEAQFIAAKPLE